MYAIEGLMVMDYTFDQLGARPAHVRLGSNANSRGQHVCLMSHTLKGLGNG